MVGRHGSIGAGRIWGVGTGEVGGEGDGVHDDRQVRAGNTTGRGCSSSVQPGMGGSLDGIGQPLFGSATLQHGGAGRVGVVEGVEEGAQGGAGFVGQAGVQVPHATVAIVGERGPTQGMLSAFVAQQGGTVGPLLTATDVTVELVRRLRGGQVEQVGFELVWRAQSWVTDGAHDGVRSGGTDTAIGKCVSGGRQVIEVVGQAGHAGGVAAGPAGVCLEPFGLGRCPVVSHPSGAVQRGNRSSDAGRGRALKPTQQVQPLPDRHSVQPVKCAPVRQQTHDPAHRPIEIGW